MASGVPDKKNQWGVNEFDFTQWAMHPAYLTTTFSRHRSFRPKFTNYTI